MVRKIVNKIHLILGLSTGLIVFIIAITGCIYAFQVEIQNTTQPFRYVKAENRPFLMPSQLKEIAVKELPGKHPHSVIYFGKEKAAQVVFFGTNPDHYNIVYLNPYSGTVLKAKDMNRDFFRIVLLIHYYLLLPPEVGQPIVASSTIIFLVMLITGIILWWPKNKRAAKQRFTIRWSTSWRRKNYDLHTVLGFYMSWVVIFIAITGLVWGFEWFAKGYFYTISGGRSFIQFYEAVSDTTTTPTLEKPATDILYNNAVAQNPSAQSIEVHYPDSKAATIGVSTNVSTDLYYTADHRYYDQYTLKEVPVTHIYGRYNSSIATADKILRMNYDIHVGAILGLPGKFLAFFASLICASMPVTGFMIWYGRRKKKKVAKGNNVLVEAN